MKGLGNNGFGNTPPSLRPVIRAYCTTGLIDIVEWCYGGLSMGLCSLVSR
jgi:hypothetical protein